jgi:hypothetical protein
MTRWRRDLRDQHVDVLNNLITAADQDVDVLNNMITAYEPWCFIYDPQRRQLSGNANHL